MPPSKYIPNNDPLYKIHPVIDLPSIVYLPGRNLNINEAMLGYKGQLHFWQYV